MALSSSTPSFIEDIATNASEANKLRALGTDSPEHLLAQIQAAPEAFERYFGPDRTKALLVQLRQIVPKDSPSVQSSTRPPGKLGVPLDSSSGGLTSPTFDIQKRDALFQRIENLKRCRARRREIRAAQQELDRLLESRH